MSFRTGCSLAWIFFRDTNDPHLRFGQLGNPMADQEVALAPHMPEVLVQAGLVGAGNLEQMRYDIV